MAIDETKLNKLLTLKAQGKTIVCAEILAVQWSDAVTKYYAISNYSNIVPFRECSLSPIEPRLLGKQFHGFSLLGDLRDENISFRFDNADLSISGLFMTHGGGRRCDLYYYYPQADLLVNVWYGQLQKPSNLGIGELNVTATNGYRSRELMLPRRLRSKHCPFTFGGKLSSAEAIETNGCPYDRHVSGTEGLLDGAVPFTSCARLSESDCSEKFGHSRYFGGHNLDASVVVTDGNSGYSATSKGNESNQKEPIFVIAGAKIINRLPLLMMRRELNSSNPERGFVRGIFDCGEGPVDRIFNIRINDKYIEQIHIDTRNGTRGQPRCAYAPNVSNFSSSAHFSAAFGWVNPATITVDNFTGAATIHGYNKVKVYTDAETSSRIWTNDRIWWLLELYTNQTFGRGYSYDKFDIESFITTSDWAKEFIRFTHPDPNASTQYFDHYRTIFDHRIDGRAAQETIVEVCRSGRIAVPFQYDGKYTTRPITAATEEELENAKVFKTAFGNNIIWENGRPVFEASEIADDKLINHLVLTFEDASNNDKARPITVDDAFQKSIAGKAVGSDDLHEIERRFTAFGVRRLTEAVKLAYGLLWFGDFDEGGIKNNCRVRFKTDLEQVLGLKKYDFIKVESDLLTGKGYTNEANEFYQFEYFRFLNAEKQSDNSVYVTAQAYNQEASESFETAVTPDDTPPVGTPPDVDIIGNPCNPTFTATFQEEGFILVEIAPC